MNAYSFWEQGRDAASGQIVSWTPIDLSRSTSSLGNSILGQGGMALSAIAQFAVFFEMRRMNHLREAEFAERRHAWLNGIITQWINEHHCETGIRRDSTLAVAKECEKMWESICENSRVDVPQTLLLQITRLSEYLDWNYRLLASASNIIVEQSQSAEQWKFDLDASSEMIASQVLSEAANETHGSWWHGLLKAAGGLPMFLIPGVGPIMGGGAVGYGLAEMVGCLTTSSSDFDRLHDYSPLLRLPIAVSLLTSASETLSCLMSEQDFSNSMRYVAIEEASNRISFVLEPVKKRPFAFLFGSKIPKLKSVPFESSAN